MNDDVCDAHRAREDERTDVLDSSGLDLRSARQGWTRAYP